MTADGQPARRLRLAFSGQAAQVMPQVEAVGAFLREAGCAAAPIQNLELATEEILTNIARHAWAGATPGLCEVAIEAVPTDGAIEVTLRTEDDGVAFDPTAAPEPDLDAPLQARAPGGLGIMLIRRMTDRQTYRRASSRNVLVVARRCAFAACSAEIQTGECGGLDVLSELDPARLAAVLAQCRIATFSAGDLMLQRGTVNDHLYFVLSGLVHVYFDGDNDAQPIRIDAGQMFGEISIIDQLPVSAFVSAAEACRVLVMPAAVFWAEVVTVPGAARAAMRGLANRLRNDAVLLSQAMREHLRHAALERELGIARDIQMGMLRRPHPWFPERPEIDVVAYMKPARQVGGDFYEAFCIDDHHLALAIGDVAGKGISAAMFMVRALTLIRSAASHWLSLTATARVVNRALAADNDASMFLTMFMGVLDTRTGQLDYVNYGHLPPLILSPDGACVSPDIPSGTMLGLIDAAEAGTGSLRLLPGSTLLLFTDGVTEASDEHGALFGTAALRAVAAAACAQAPQTIVDGVASAVTRYAGAAEQADDITLLAARYNGPGCAGLAE